MTRLTLEWHLRGIVEGTVEPICVRQDIEWCDLLERWDRTGDRYYADPTVEGTYEQVDTRAEAGSYTTGFTQESGDFCSAFDIPASKALKSDDTVAFLDAVAHDPTRRYQERYDAAVLLDFHIWPDSPKSHENGVIDAERDDIDVSEWVDQEMVGKDIGPTYLPARCSNPECTEGECLADPDVLRDKGVAVCMMCDTEQPNPVYP